MPERIICQEFSSWVGGPLPAVVPVRPAPPWPFWLLVALTIGATLLIVAFALHLAARRALRPRAYRNAAALTAVVGLAIGCGAWQTYLQHRPADVSPAPRDRLSDENASVSKADASPAAGLAIGATPSSDDWSTDRGGFRRTGAVPGQSGPRLGAVVWRHRREGESFYGAPGYSRGRVYAVGSTEDRGRIYAFDAQSGAVCWAVSPPDYRAAYAAPVIRGDRLYCGEGLHETTRARLLCLDLRPGREGELRWTFATAGHVECTPTVVGPYVFFGAGDDGVYCLEETEGEREPRVVFHARGELYPDVEASVAVDGGRLFFGLGLHGDGVAALDARDGRRLGRLRLPGPTFSPPGLARGKLVLGFGAPTDLDSRRPNAGGGVVCVDSASFQIDWTFTTPSPVVGAVAVVDEQLHFASEDGWVYVLDLDGKELRRASVGASVYASPAVTADRIYAVAGDGRLVALDRRTLRSPWSVRIGRPGEFYAYTSAPLVAQERIFLGSYQEGFLAVGEPADDEEVNRTGRSRNRSDSTHLAAGRPALSATVDLSATVGEQEGTR